MIVQVSRHDAGAETEAPDGIDEHGREVAARAPAQRYNPLIGDEGDLAPQEQIGNDAPESYCRMVRPGSAGSRGDRMPHLSVDERNGLQVDDFIFHVVHHGEDAPILLDSTPIGQFEAFFVGRIADTLRGNRYVFDDGSRTLASLLAMRDGAGAFVEASKDLARAFHKNDGRFQRGILIVTTLRSGTRRFVSIIKYDHEPMVAFDVVDRTAALRAVVTGLTESPRAIQKSALIELVGGGGNLVVLDRGKRTGITDFFRDFLGVDRVHDETAMTTLIARALLRTVKENAGTLPTEITANVKRRLVQVAELRGDFEADEFFGDFFGAHGSDAVKVSYGQALEAVGLTGEAFTFDPAALPREVTSRYRTQEGVSIVVPAAAKGTVKISDDPEGGHVITIRTTHVTER